MIDGECELSGKRKKNGTILPESLGLFLLIFTSNSYCLIGTVEFAFAALYAGINIAADNLVVIDATMSIV